jgi:hypothetical protein
VLDLNDCKNILLKEEKAPKQPNIDENLPDKVQTKKKHR